MDLFALFTIKPQVRCGCQIFSGSGANALFRVLVAITLIVVFVFGAGHAAEDVKSTENAAYTSLAEIGESFFTTAFNREWSLLGMFGFRRDGFPEMERLRKYLKTNTDYKNLYEKVESCLLRGDYAQIDTGELSRTNYPKMLSAYCAFRGFNKRKDYSQTANQAKGNYLIAWIEESMDCMKNNERMGAISLFLQTHSAIISCLLDPWGGLGNLPASDLSVVYDGLKRMENISKEGMLRYYVGSEARKGGIEMWDRRMTISKMAIIKCMLDNYREIYGRHPENLSELKTKLNGIAALPKDIYVDDTSSGKNDFGYDCDKQGEKWALFTLDSERMNLKHTEDNYVPVLFNSYPSISRGIRIGTVFFAGQRELFETGKTRIGIRTYKLTPIEANRSSLKNDPRYAGLLNLSVR